MPQKAPSTPAKGDTRKFWSQHSVSPDTTKLKSDIKKMEARQDSLFKKAKAEPDTSSDINRTYSKAEKHARAMDDSLRTKYSQLEKARKKKK